MTDANILAAQRVRIRHLVWPREHGAWGMLLVPLITGAWIAISAGGSAWRIALFACVTMAVFCLRTPVESLLGTSPLRVASAAERSMVVRYATGFALLSLFTLGLLFWGGKNLGLLALGAVVATLLLAQFAIKRLGRQGRMPSQVIGALALTSTAPGAYYVATGHFDLRALGLWFANWVFAGNQIHFVQLRLQASKCGTWKEKAARGRGFFIGQAVMILALIGGWAFGLVPALIMIAFLPIFIRGLYWLFSSPQPLALRRIGMTELAHAVAFGGLLVLALR